MDKSQRKVRIGLEDHKKCWKKDEKELEEGRKGQKCLEGQKMIKSVWGDNKWSEDGRKKGGQESEDDRKGLKCHTRVGRE